MGEQVKLDVFITEEKVREIEKERVEDQGPYELPKSWKWVNLRSVVKGFKNGIYKPAQFYGRGYPCIRMYNIENRRIDLKSVHYLDVADEELEKYGLKTNDILFNRVNSIELVGKVALVQSGLGPCTFESKNIRIRVDNTIINPAFLVYFLDSEAGKSQIRRRIKPAVQQATVNQEDLKSIKIVLAPLEEQKRVVARIGELVSNAEKARRLRKVAAEEAEKIMQAALHKVFSRAKEEGWKWEELDRVGKYINGRAFKKEEWETKGLPIIRIQNLTNPNAPFNYCSQPVEEKYYVKNGDLLISWSATLDVFAWNRGDAILNQHIFRVEVNEKLIDKNFMFYAIKHVLRQIQEKIHGSTMKHITKGKFENIKVPLPPLEDQKRIAAYLDRVRETAESLKKLQQRTEKELEKLVSAILDRAFKGYL